MKIEVSIRRYEHGQSANLFPLGIADHSLEYHDECSHDLMNMSPFTEALRQIDMKMITIAARIKNESKSRY